MRRGFSRRGQPLIVLVMLLGGWVSARAMMWDSASLPAAMMPVAEPLAAFVTPGDVRNPALPGSEAGALVVAEASNNAAPLPDNVAQPEVLSLATSPKYRPETVSFAPTEPVFEIQAPNPPQPTAPPPPKFGRVPPAIAAGHQLLWMAALAHIPMPAELLGLSSPAATPVPFYPGESQARHSASDQGLSRWSADGWLLWRRGSKAAPLGGLLTPSYGASQLGAVLRYRIAPDSAHRPAAYLRATAALNGSGEREAALGLTLRPISRLPLSLQGEARFTSTPGGQMVRPAAFVVTELPPFALPLGLRGETYGQAGYVGGKFATGFADGQLRLDRRLVRLGKADLRLGGGVWGGIQKGASRLDAGPSLTIGQPLGGPASMRLAADWRFRVAGKAAPGSGPAVTLSAGF